MIRLLMIVVIILSTSITLAATRVFMPTDKLPREIIYLTESLQELQAKDIVKTKDNDALFKKLELKFQLLSKQELYFIAKSEVYKTSLAFKPPLKVKNKFYLKKIVTEIEDKLKIVKLNSFSHWLVTSILKDVNDLFDNRHFPTFTIERNRGVISSSSSKRLQKKFNFLLPWMQSFLAEDGQLFQYSLLPLMKKILNKLFVKIEYLTVHTNRLGPSGKKEIITYFKEQTIQLDKTGKPISVEDILDPLIGRLKNKNLPIPVDDWLEDEDDFAKGLTPIKIQKPTGNYVAPEKLPTPVDDWQ
jgi:hypothetical protein